ncbi:MAG: zf-HC2 domain-containing protein [Bacteroidota bacterium]
MDCLLVRDHLFSYQEKQLSGNDKKAFEDHLHSCEMCSQIANGFQIVTAYIDQKKSDKPDPFIRTRTLQRIESELERSSTVATPFFRRNQQPVLATLLLLISIAIGFSVGRQINPKEPGNTEHQYEIETIKSGLFIQDFIDNDKLFLKQQ